MTRAVLPKKRRVQRTKRRRHVSEPIHAAQPNFGISNHSRGLIPKSGRRRVRTRRQRGGAFFQDLSDDNENRATTFAAADVREIDSLPTLMTVNKAAGFLGTA
jgi:hypothetical protein